MKITIIMATYNRAHFLLESLQSIINQVYTNWECLIIDDGGTDNTKQIISPIIENDKRFKYLQRPNSYKKGLSGCRNYGLDLAKGDAFVFFDDDDIIHPLNIEICSSFLKKFKNLSFCKYRKESFLGVFNYDKIDYNLDYNYKETGDKLLENVITQKLPFASCTVLWKKECFLENRFNENLMYGEEWECYQRILSNKIKGVILDKVLYYNRKHDASNTSEFWSKTPIRVNSKKKAIELIAINLKNKHLLSPDLIKYLVNLAIGFRDFKLTRNILRITKLKLKLKLFYIAKYYLFPFWVIYKNKLK